jgi:GT2 family glycosyltransferase
MRRASLSVVIVTYNSAGTIERCLASLQPQLRQSDEVFVVDNASTDVGPGSIHLRHPGLRIIRNVKNVGFARACNQAIRIATGRFILLLNPDTQLDAGAIARAVGYLRSHPDAGVLGAKVRLQDGRVDPAAHRSFKQVGTYFYKVLGLSRLFPRHPRFGRYYLSHRRLNHVSEVDSVVGAFLLIRSQVVDAIGLLDERFFMYCEDEDWCWRAKCAGWRVVYHPGVVVRHQKGSSARQAPLRTLYHWHRSTYLYHRKNIAPTYAAPVNLGVYSGLIAVLGARVVRQLAARSALWLLSRKPTFPMIRGGASAEGSR